MRWLAGGLGLILLGGQVSAQTSRQTNSPSGRRQPSRSEGNSGEYPSQSRGYRNDGTGSRTRPGDTRANPTESRSRPPEHSTNAPDHTVRNPDHPASGSHSASPATSITKKTPNGEITTTSSGRVKEKIEKKPDGEHVQHFAPTGRVQSEVVHQRDGVQQTTHYSPGGQVQKTVVVSKDGAKQTTNLQYDRNGKERAAETIKIDARGREVSKTVVIKQTTVIVKNTTIVNNTTIVRNYDRARYGFVYRPVYVVHSPVFVSWYDPYWYGPSGVLIVHPFQYSWGWDVYGWYRYHRHYWAVYDVYPAPSYWVTDWLIAGYVADRYAASVSVAQAREEARIAQEDAANARLAAQQAQQQADIAEARAAQSEAEARAAKAEARVVRAETEEARAKTQGTQPNPNIAPVDPETKEALRKQIEQAVAEKKEFAEQAAKGKNPVPPDVSKCLADPKHIYPVSSAINVISAVDQSPAGTLTEGDLLRLEPGQESILKNANENTFVTLRVMTSKGEDGEAKAGTLISVSLKSLQDFDSEFRAKLDLGLVEADKNKNQFKTGAL